MNGIEQNFSLTMRVYENLSLVICSSLVSMSYMYFENSVMQSSTHVCETNVLKIGLNCFD